MGDFTHGACDGEILIGILRNIFIVSATTLGEKYSESVYIVDVIFSRFSFEGSRLGDVCWLRKGV